MTPHFSGYLRPGPTVALRGHVESTSCHQEGHLPWPPTVHCPRLLHRKPIIQIYAGVRTDQVSIGMRCQVSEKSEAESRENWVQLRQS